MQKDIPHILLVNPWIHDFAAYDVWDTPLGLLTLAAILRSHGYRVSYVDCLDRFHPRAPASDLHLRNGRGPYIKREIPKPEGLQDVPRRFSRYGIHPEWLAEDLLSVQRPDLVLVTSFMTYWAPGVRETITAIRSIHPEVPVVLGGIYAGLCLDHAEKNAGADRVIAGSCENRILALTGSYTGWHETPRFDTGNLDDYPYPAFDLQRKIPYVPLLTSKGCPFSCDYCAAHFLHPERMQRSPQSVVDEIRFWNERHGTADFAFYDDALLVDAENHALPMLDGLVTAGLNIRCHTPNALHIREITRQTADLMYRAGFQTLRLGLETAVSEHRRVIDRKVTITEFKQAVHCLTRAGFDPRQIGVYLLAGLPGQPISSVLASIDRVKAVGAVPIPAYYTPIPHTAMWEQAVASSRYDLATDPVFSNNAVFPCQKEPFSWEIIKTLKKRIAE